MTLADLGWNDIFEKEFTPYYQNGWKPARLIRDNKITYGALLIDAKKKIDEREVIMSGKVYHDAECDADLPAVGDWVALDLGEENVIRARLARQTCFSRKAAGHSAEEQVIAANVTTVIVVTDAGPDFNLRRMERYFTIIARSGAKPVVVVNKSDLYPEKQNQEAAEAIRALHKDAEVFVTSVEKRKGVRALKPYFKKGQTVAFIGSSGVGKSAMINLVLGDDWQWTDEVNEVTGKGRHTTTARELLILDKGGIIVDNPGIREVQMWTDERTLRERFADISALTLNCRFDNCKHGKDAGCAIRDAVEQKQLDPARHESFLKLDEEIEALRRQRKKRQMTIERITKRDYHIRHKKHLDRRERHE
ncbi:ribosome small subunit-dependent GTPase A [Phragmitibacter flavus]|uniref:Small ribosomal subunit biogenesis GTPase RsgA n=1 Tax=Phragmitibacter flavus TaxID=2576071 RepID=A0A5R8KB52_9BACT|nr:ribosome small subunit-dependent GTPase A [Phragmitibacter flavus]TLD69145.1 ribosome small subunit-dependent GTPase A [Phragmitibacter flavus]